MTILEPTDLIKVTVLWLENDLTDSERSLDLPEGITVEHLQGVTVEHWRWLYNTVGQPWLWWMRRAMRDEALNRHLEQPWVQVWQLSQDGVVRGFYELDTQRGHSVIIHYLGLFPDAIGLGLGRVLLGHALARAQAQGAVVVGLTTCSADHPQALPNYQRAGFRVMREAEETWPIPTRLGFVIPDHLRVNIGSG